MNIYQRLINVLAESINPEYWSIKELVHYLRLSQNEFARQTRITRRNIRLASSFDINTIDSQPVFRSGEYDIPSDCLEIISVQWKERPLDQKGITFLESAYSGTGAHEVIRGVGRFGSKGWRSITGEPLHWIYDNKSVRLFPSIKEEPEVTLISSDINADERRFPVYFNDKSDVSVLLRIYTETEENGEVYTGQSLYLTLARKDYSFCISNSQFYILISDDISSRIKSWISSGYKISIMAYEASKAVTADYVYQPSFKVVEPFSYDQENCVVTELSEQWHEAIVCYAAYLALSKEGDKTQDINKAGIYLDRFNNFVEHARRMTDGEIDVDPFVRLPFVI